MHADCDRGLLRHPRLRLLFLEPCRTAPSINNLGNTYILDVSLGTDSTLRFRNVRVFYRRVLSPAPTLATFADVPTTHLFLPRDRGALGVGRHVGLRQRKLLSRQHRHARRDGGIPREGLRAVTGRTERGAPPLTLAPLPPSGGEGICRAGREQRKALRRIRSSPIRRGGTMSIRKSIAVLRSALPGYRRGPGGPSHGSAAARSRGAEARRLRRQVEGRGRHEAWSLGTRRKNDVRGRLHLVRRRLPARLPQHLERRAWAS